MDEKSEVKFELGQNYNFKYEFIQKNLLTVLIMIALVFPSYNLGFIRGYAAVICMYLIFLIAYSVTNKIKYTGIKCCFYENKLIYTKKFLNSYVKEIKYSDIKEISIEQNYIQRIFKQGNVFIQTNSGKIIKNGVVVLNVENPEEKVKKISELIK